MRQQFVAIVVGDTVEAGRGEEHDTGRVHEISTDGCKARVGWDSGVETWTPIEDLAEALAPWATTIIPCEGGCQAFESVQDAATWQRQT